MEKEIILLAKSKKYNNLCVAGIDTTTGEWIRIVSDDESIKCAIKPEDALYEDESHPELFDIVRIQCTGQSVNYFQSENYVNDPGYYWKKTGEATIWDVIRIHPLGKHYWIFYNRDKKLHKDYLLAIGDHAKYSLMLVVGTNIIMHIERQNGKRKIKMDFDYKGNRYHFLPVTDLEFEATYEHLELGDYELDDGTFFVMSLGECYDWDNCHYKLIATVIEP